MKKNLFILIVGAIALVACQPKDIEPESLFKSAADVEAMLKAEPAGYILYNEANGGLNQFVKDYMTEEGDFELVRTRSKDESKNPGICLFSIDTIPVGGKGIYIMGRVTTDDGGGNFYKAIVIQQMVGGKQQALRLSVDAGNASGLYPLGQQLLIRVNGLAIGKYANQPQLCVPSYNNNIYASSANQKVGWAPSRIPSARFNAATTLIGKPDISALHYDEITFDQLVTTSSSSSDGYGKTLIGAVDAREWDGKLVRVKNVHFTGEYADTYGKRAACTTGDPEIDEKANVFGPTTRNVGYPQSRVISDGSLYLMVSTSEYAKYAHMYLPDAEYTGTVEGILGYYMDNARFTPTWKTWSISIRDLNDLKLFSGSQAWEPKEYSK